MIRLIYMSTAKHLFSAKELEELLDKSVENNKKIDVTGLLITKGKTFLQCIEGEEDDVIGLYEKIKKDDRHSNVIDLIEEECEDRLFPQWSMGFISIKDLSLIESEKIKELEEKDIKGIEKSDVYEIFEYFIK